MNLLLPSLMMHTGDDDDDDDDNDRNDDDDDDHNDDDDDNGIDYDNDDPKCQGRGLQPVFPSMLAAR